MECFEIAESEMDAAGFRAWRARLGLTQQQAAAKLGVSTLTVQHYERGARHGTGKPVVIPRRVVLACEMIEQNVEKEPVTRLVWRGVAQPALERVRGYLSDQGFNLEPSPILSFHLRHYRPFSAQISTWLDTYVAERGYVKVVVPDSEAEDGAFVILHFAHQDDAFGFAIEFGGRPIPHD